jgi:hypothetical protein
MKIVKIIKTKAMTAKLVLLEFYKETIRLEVQTTVANLLYRLKIIF